jgi:hypothetical protein
MNGSAYPRRIVLRIGRHPSGALKAPSVVAAQIEHTIGGSAIICAIGAPSRQREPVSNALSTTNSCI